MKSFSACIVVYKTHRLAFVLIGENIHTIKVLCTVCLNPDPNKGGQILRLITVKMHDV